MLVILFVFEAVLLVTYGFAVRGVLSSRNSRDSAIIVLFCTMGYFVLVGGGPVGGSRFRHTIMPFLCVLAAAGVRPPRVNAAKMVLVAKASSATQ